MAVERLPFELAKPSNDTFVTKTSEIGHNGEPLDQALGDLSKLDNISEQSTQSEEQAVIYETDGGVQVGKIDANGADFANLKRGGQQVARMSDLPTKDSSIGENPSTTHIPTTKAVKDYVDANSGGDYPIETETTQSADEEQVWGNDAETQEYAKIGSYGIKSKAYLDMQGSSIIEGEIGNTPSTTHAPSVKAMKDYVDEHGGGTGDLPISKETTSSSDKEVTIYDDNNQPIAKMKEDGLYVKNIFTLAGKPLANKQSVIVVDANGNGDYTTIEDALNNAGDTATNHVVIQINEGVYTPPPKISFNAPYVENQRNLTLRGVNRNKCIIRGDIGFYDYTIGTDCAPLRLNGNVVIENLTILSYSSEYRTYYGTEGFVTTRENRNAAYCIHRDGQSREGDEFLVKNCILINDHMTTIGFGLKPNVILRIEDCYLQSEQNEDDSACNSYGTLYGHMQSSQTGLGQNLEIIRCQIVNKTSYQAINLMDAKPESATPENTFANFKFIGNTVSTTDNSRALVIASSLTGFYEISPLSWGNKWDGMNANNN